MTEEELFFLTTPQFSRWLKHQRVRQRIQPKVGRSCNSKKCEIRTHENKEPRALEDTGYELFIQ